MEGRPIAAAVILGLSILSAQLEETAAYTTSRGGYGGGYGGNPSGGGYGPTPINGEWGSWSKWGTCSKACGGGEQMRSRECNNPAPAHGGAFCQGGPDKAGQLRSCNEQQCQVNGGWTEWSTYGECSAACGGGQKIRTRTCTNPAPSYGGSTCYGEGTSTEACNSHHCAINGGWTEWSTYGECSAACGGGQKVRTRTCTNPAPSYGGSTCYGEGTSTEACNSHHCAINGGWTEWSTYGECSAACGGGQKVRTRTCTNPAPSYGGSTCYGEGTSTEDCNSHHCAINGGWTEWGAYGECTASCGGGTKERSRTCTNPEPAYGGSDCYGSATDSKQCNSHHCPVDGNWSEWSSYGACNVTCGGGFQSRQRTCTYPAPAYGGANCYGPSNDYKLCNQVSCAVDGGWSYWSSYGECTVTCGGGTQTRQRTCSNPSPAYGGATCYGSSSSSKSCNDSPCPIDGEWSEWGSYSECSASCGSGQHTKHRTCTNPSPAYGGAECYGHARFSEACNNYPCAIDGGWSEWSTYGECSASCGDGQEVKVRTCTNPAPEHGGADCYGESSHSQPCNYKPCPIDGGWSSWSTYGYCSATCGGGVRTRTRTCTEPSPAYGGAQCAGYASAETNCNDDIPCPVDGEWTSWGYWSSCSNTCGSGQSTRSRTCTNPSPAYGGSQCAGEATESKNCEHQYPCPRNGGWSEWGSWTTCAGVCNRGRQYSIRTCTNPLPRNGGSQCSGSNTKSRQCTNSATCRRPTTRGGYYGGYTTTTTTTPPPPPPPRYY